MTARFGSGVLALRFQTASLRELIEMRRVAAQYGPDVHDLRISMGSFSDDRRWFTLCPGPKYVDYLPIYWDALFVHLPGLRRLDLSEMPPANLHAKMIVEVAGERCIALEALILPSTPTYRGVGCEAERMVRALFGAMKKWGAREANPGLRQLTVPCLLGIRSRTELVQHVLTD